MSVAVDCTSFSEELAAGRLYPIDLPRAVRDVGGHGLLCPAPTFLHLPRAFGGEMDRAAVTWAGVCAEEAALHLSERAPLAWIAPLARTAAEAGVPALVVRALPPPEVATYNATGAALGRAALLCGEWGTRLCLATGDGPTSALSWAREMPRMRLLIDLAALDALPHDAARCAALGPLVPHARLARLAVRGAAGEGERVTFWAWALQHRRFAGTLVLCAEPGAGDADIYRVLGDAAAAVRNGVAAA